MLPLFNTYDVINTLSESIKDVEIFDEYPNDDEVVRNGVYVSDVVTSSRTPYQLGVQTGSHIYTCVDSFSVTFITYQGDEYRDSVMNSIQSLVENNVLFDTYHERNFSIDQKALSRAEYKIFNFEVSRIEFQ